MGKRELVALLSLSSWCLVIVVWLFFSVSWVCLLFVIFLIILTIFYDVSDLKTWRDGSGLMLWLLSGSPGFTYWISFAPVFSFIDS